MSISSADLKLRIGNCDEGALAKGLEAFDTINRVIEEHVLAGSATAAAASAVEEVADAPPQPPAPVLVVAPPLPPRAAAPADLLTPGASHDAPLMDF